MTHQLQTSVDSQNATMQSMQTSITSQTSMMIEMRSQLRSVLKANEKIEKDVMLPLPVLRSRSLESNVLTVSHPFSDGRTPGSSNRGSSKRTSQESGHLEIGSRRNSPKRWRAVLSDNASCEFIEKYGRPPQVCELEEMNANSLRMGGSFLCKLVTKCT